MGMFVSKQKLRGVTILATLALAALVGILNTPTMYAAPRLSNTYQRTDLAPQGTWKTLTPSSHSPNVPVPPPNGGGNCPSNATKYSGSLAPWNCYEIVRDGELHGVWLRVGSTGNSGFGVLHFTEHNLYITSVEAVIESQEYGIKQSNGRYLYGAYFEEPNGGTAQYVQVYEERGPSNKSGVNDGGEFGVVTAYCEDEYRNEEQICPDWVNETL